MIDLRHQVVKDQEINLLNDSNLAHKLSHGLIMEDCVINSKVSAKGIIMAQAKFINCTFNFKTQLNNFSFASSYFEGCIFTGKLSGCEFGHGEWTHKPEEEKVIPGIKNCDFSKMTLFSGIRFIDCDIETILFPKFPHFTIKYPKKNAEVLLESDFPDLFKARFRREWLRETDNALVLNAYEESKRLNISVDEIKRIASQYDFIDF